MIIAINYANEGFQKAQKLNLETALKWGADKVIGYTPSDIDAGSIYINQIQYLIDCMEREDLNIMTFSLEKAMLERRYTKRDAFILMDCDAPRYADTPQSIGGYVILKKSSFVERFLEEDLTYAQDSRIITEESNTQGMDNYPDFITHRLGG